MLKVICEYNPERECVKGGEIRELGNTFNLELAVCIFKK